MADPDSVSFMETDAQDLAEVFDETHLDEDGDDFAMPEEMTDVYDATRDQGRPMPSRLSPHLPAQSSGVAQSRDSLSAQADTLLGQPAHDDDDESETSPVAYEEIELVYTGLMRNQRGAQGSASHWEARNLSDDDIRDLGYAPDSDPPVSRVTETGPSRGATMTNPIDRKQEDDPHSPAIRSVPREHGKPDQLKEKLKDAEDRQEALIDEAVEESMDASDPPSPKHIT